MGDKVTGMNGWGSAKLDEVGRNKVFMTLQILTLTDLDIVFTDADNVFPRDPFRPGVNLGDMIRSQKYDFVDQQEIDKRPPRSHRLATGGGNSGFWYASVARKPKNVKTFFRAWLDRVDLIREESSKKRKDGGKTGADQPILHDIIGFLRASKGKDPDKWGFKCAALCDNQDGTHNPRTCNAPPEETFEYCYMDPYTHPTGWPDARPKEFATYHANYAHQGYPQMS